MSAYKRCPECGYYLAKFTIFFTEAKKVLYNKTYNNSQIDPEKIILKKNKLPPLEIIFDALEIKNRCCRMHIFTKSNID